MSNISKINYIVNRVFEEAEAYDINASSDLITDIATGGRELFFDFRKNGRYVVVTIDESYIYSVKFKDIDSIVNSVIEKMEEVL